MKARHTSCVVFSSVAWQCTLLRLLATAILAMFLAPSAVRAAAIDPYGAGINAFATQIATIQLPGVGSPVPVTFTGYPNPNNPLFPLPSAIKQFDSVFFMHWADPLSSQVGPAATYTFNQSPWWTCFTQCLPPGFDMVLQRSPAKRPTGVGGTLDVSFEILWLSLRSTQPVFVPGLGLADVYIGLDSAAQIPGVLRLTSLPSGGYFGLLDLGTTGVTTDDPFAPGFLGLPIAYDAVYVPLDPTVAALRQNGLQGVFHSSAAGHSGTYDVMPEPSALYFVAGGSLMLIALGRKRQGRR